MRAHLGGVQGDEQAGDGVLHRLSLPGQCGAQAAQAHELRHDGRRPHLSPHRAAPSKKPDGTTRNRAGVHQLTGSRRGRERGRLQ